MRAVRVLRRRMSIVLHKGDLMNERLIALDIGDKRIGLAVSDALGYTAQPIGKIDSVGWGPDIRRIEAYCAEYQTYRLVVGLPRQMDGTLGKQAEKVRSFAEKLTEAGLDVSFWDERMTTVSAERVLIGAGMRRENRKQVVDQMAAAIILQAYLDANREPGRISPSNNDACTGRNEACSMDYQENHIVELIGEDGTLVSFEHLMTLEHEKKMYIMLTPVEPETPDEEGMVVIMRIAQDEKGEDCYVVEEDEGVLETVFNRFMELMDEEDAEDTDEDAYEAEDGET